MNVIEMKLHIKNYLNNELPFNSLKKILKINVDINESNLRIMLSDELIFKKYIKKLIYHINIYGNNVDINKFYLAINNKKKSCVEIDKIYGVKIKRNRKNIYDPEYISQREGISYEEAVTYINNYKKEKATSYDGFVKRHGKILGEAKFKKFQETSRTNTKDFYINKYGEDWEKFYKIRIIKNPRCLEYWVNLGFNIIQAKEMVSIYQKANSGVNKLYWVNKGKSLQEINKILYSINQKRGDSYLTYKNLIESGFCFEDAEIIIFFIKCFNNIKNIDNSAYLLLNSSKNKYLTIVENFDLFKNIFIEYKKNRSDFIKYSKLVDFFTSQNKDLLKKLPNYDNSDKYGKFQLDHIYSKRDGFDNNIPPEVIGSIINLRYISKIENQRKWRYSEFSKELLLNKYLQYKERKNED